MTLLSLLTAVKSGAPKPTHVIPSQRRDHVTAMASLGNEVFILRLECQQQVKVFDASTSLVVTKNHNILVADVCNSRILLVNNSLSFARKLTLSVVDDGIGLKLPCGLCLDESRGRLYVDEVGGSHRELGFYGVGL